MSLYVLDSFVAVKWVLPEPGSLKALAFRDDVFNSIHEIIAPEVFASEVAHALTKAERQKILSVEEAAIHLADILDAGPILVPYAPRQSCGHLVIDADRRNGLSICCVGRA